ncbi:MAG: hypothetical protein J0626_04415, partial [Rhodospirillaceae bacterium]|nr:hypothetical protein [Rhodospirillaceae bacterium]
KTMRSRAPWDIGLKALPDADAARNVVIPDSEIAKLIAAAYRDSHGFGLLVETAAMTGARYSQIAGLLVRDLQG